MATEGAAAESGVQLRAVEGRRSSQRVGKDVYASAARYVDAALADSIESQPKWRKTYLEPVRNIVALGARSPKDALRIATDGLDALHRNLEFVRDGVSRPLPEAMSAFDNPGFSTEIIQGRGDAGPRELVVPFRGRALKGDALLAQLNAWEGAGTIEPSCAEAVSAVVRSPEWLDLSDKHVALLGGASEMGPLSHLCEWGANVLAIDLPNPRLWKKILDIAQRGSGRVFVPVRKGRENGDLVESAGADVLEDLPEIRNWFAGFNSPLVVADRTYADGAKFVRLVGAIDALIMDLAASNRLDAISYLATPTDVFAVESDTARLATTSLRGSPAKAVLRTISAGSLYKPSYSSLIHGEDGREWGICDSLVAQQGPGYALAKNVQRWRAVVAREEGTTVSANVAPPTRTRSVTKNKLLAAAYRGAPKYGVNVFESPTSGALMAALLVHDLRTGAQPASTEEHPYDLFCRGAAHGGMWRLPYEPRSVLPLAVVRGIAKRS